MNVRPFVSACVATTLLALAAAACAVDSGDHASAQTENAMKGAPAPTVTPTNPCTYIKCSAGYSCDPKAGACVADAPAPVAAPAATASAKPPALVCPMTKCSNGYHCEEPVGCVPNVFDCSTVRCTAGTTNIPSLGCCLPTCGGFLGTPCTGGGTCVDDPSDKCDPKNGGADCMGVCIGGGAK